MATHVEKEHTHLIVCKNHIIIRVYLPWRRTMTLPVWFVFIQVYDWEQEYAVVAATKHMQESLSSRDLAPNPQYLSGSLPQNLWRLGWWGRHSLVPRRCTPPHVHAPVAQPCTLWRPRPTRALSGHWSSWRSVCRPGWAAPYGPTPCGLWRSSHSNWCTENSIVRVDAISQTEHHT